MFFPLLSVQTFALFYKKEGGLYHYLLKFRGTAKNQAKFN